MTLKKCLNFLGFIPIPGDNHPARWKCGYACFDLTMTLLVVVGVAEIMRGGLPTEKSGPQWRYPV